MKRREREKSIESIYVQEPKRGEATETPHERKEGGS